MITPQELRIGNWLMYGIKPVQVQYIDPEREIIDMGLKCSIGVAEYVDKHHIATNGRWLNHFEPIPITPEVLVNCGFKKTLGIDAIYFIDNIGWDSINGITIRVLYRNEINRRCTDWSHYDHIEHLHQLQNLFFALTGEELNYST